MTHIEKAITDAVEHGGWDWQAFQARAGLAEDSDAPIAEVMMDREFWQALGKARGWDGPAYFRSKDYEVEPWKFFALSFMEHIMCGDDAESFFAALTKSK